MDELREKLKGFDWYYQFSDDQNTWRKWGARKIEIIDWIKENKYDKEQVMTIVREAASDPNVQRDWEQVL